MIDEQKKLYLRYIIGSVIFCVCLYQVLNIYVFSNAVFDISYNEKQEINWEYLEEREKRNVEKMKKSYRELMAIGDIFVAQGNWDSAIENFYWAKTLFPENISPRKNLCYSYFMKCQEDTRYCSMGKKELYYAMQYVDPLEDNLTYQYLNNLVDLVDFKEVIDKPEDEALAYIY